MSFSESAYSIITISNYTVVESLLLSLIHQYLIFYNHDWPMKKKNICKNKKSTISSHIMRAFLISTLIPTICVVALLIYNFHSSYIQSSKHQIDSTTSIVTSMLSSNFEKLTIVTMAPYYSEYFNSSYTLDKDDPNFPSEYLSFQKSMQTVFNLTTYSNSDILDLIVWTDNILYNHILFNEGEYAALSEKIEEESWFQRAFKKQGAIAFSPANSTANGEEINPSIYFVTRQIRNLHLPEQKNVIILELSTKQLVSDLNNLALSGNSFIVITNEDHEVLATSRAFNASMLPSILSDQHINDGEHHWECSSASLNQYGLNIHVVHCLDDFYDQIKSMILKTLMIYSVFLAIAYLTYQKSSRWIIHSIQPLLDTFNRVENGNLEEHCPELDVREFDQLSRSTNQMMDELDTRIKNEYVLTLQQKTLQLYALQSQIQPHFLNNTLFCFIALNQLGEQEKLNNALYQLSDLLKYTLSPDQNSTLEKEYDFLNDYLSLQKLRFGDRLTYSLRCDDKGLKDISIPRLLLEPLVENAIIHGIEPSLKHCHCTVESESNHGMLYLRIIDDGAGFSQEEMNERLESIKQLTESFDITLYKQATREKTSVGIYYVKQRMQIWSQSATLRIFREGGYTISEISVPFNEVKHEHFNS